MVATTGSGSIEPETPRQTPLGNRETISQNNQRNSPRWCDPTDELKSVQNWTAPRSCPPFSCLVASQFSPPTLSPFHLLETAYRLTCFSPYSFSSSRTTLERFSRRKRALTCTSSLSRAWVLLLAVLSVFGLLPNCVTSHSQFSMQRPKPCLCHWIVSSCCWCCASRFVELTNVTVASTVMGEWSKIKHKTDHVDANLQMILKESHWTKWPIVRQHIQMICHQKTNFQKCFLPEKEMHDALRALHYNMRFNTKLCAHHLEWAQRGARQSPEIIANNNSDAIGFNHIRNPALFLKWITPCVQQIVTLASPWWKGTPIPLSINKRKHTTTYQKNTHSTKTQNTTKHN